MPRAEEGEWKGTASGCGVSSAGDENDLRVNNDGGGRALLMHLKSLNSTLHKGRFYGVSTVSQ